jgi:hypothetical protein
MSGFRGAPGSSTSPGSDEGVQQQVPVPVLDATIKSRVSSSAERVKKGCSLCEIAD